MGKSRDNDADDSEDDGKRKTRSDEEEDGKEKKSRKRTDDLSDSSEDERRKKRRKKSKSRKHKKSKKSRKKRSRREESSSSDDSSSEEEEKKSKKKVVNQRLLQKLAARGETLEERDARRSERRAAKISAKFGYTADDNPFNDPNLHETFTWKKKDQTKPATADASKPDQDTIFGEIDKVRKRRQDRELQFEEMERIRAEESRMKELENYDEWVRKEEDFHLQQQRQRSAIRLVEGREKPVDVLAKNLLMFGLSDQEQESRAAVKYRERYNALNELDNLEAELSRPFDILKDLKQEELNELVLDINAFRTLEREANGGTSQHNDTVLRYWDNLHLVTEDEVQFLKDGGDEGPRATTIQEIQKLFAGQSLTELAKMQTEIHDRIRRTAHAAAMNQSGQGDVEYWKTVLEQLGVHKAKTELSELHNKMLVKQLERLEEKKVELEAAEAREDSKEEKDDEAAEKSMVPKNVDPEFGNLEEELGLSDEIDISTKAYSWQDKFRPRKPRYFHRVKSGYDWNAYNKTHYDQETPPPKIVQGYRFNVFYPDLIDRSKTPQFLLEKADSDEYCIIRFSAGPPYEDIAFKIINHGKDTCPIPNNTDDTMQTVG